MDAFCFMHWIPQGFLGDLVVNSPANARDVGPIPGLGRFHGQRRGTGYSPWDHRVGHNLATILQQLGISEKFCGSRTVCKQSYLISV